jgi:hypothetical protein
MRYKLTFVTGFAVGYTLGAKAGRERYEQISRVLSGLSENPAVQSAAGVLQAQASQLVGNAKQAVVDKLPGGASDTTPAFPAAATTASVRPNGASPTY